MRRLLMTILVLCVFLMPVSAQDADTEELEFLLEDYVYEDEPALVLFVSYQGEEWVGVGGLADIDNNTPARTDDLFRIASITKPFVATIILQLVAEGKIELDAPIADYLPDEIVNRVENADTATVRQMLQMTSGIFDYTEDESFNEITEADPERVWTAATTIEMIYGDEAYFAAGEDYYYSNSNYNLAQIIIESVTGMSLADNLETRIFEPVGMSSCYLETPDRFAQDIVRGYQYGDDDELVDITEINDGIGLGDGGIVCNAADLAKFLPALAADLLPEAMLDEMLDTVDDGEGGQYGLGIISDDGDYGWVVGHDGASSGFQSTMLMLPDEDLVIVILTNNFDSDLIEYLTYDVLDLILGEE